MVTEQPARRAEMFPTLGQAQIERMHAAGHERAFHAGQILFEQGEASTSFLVVIEGSVEILHPHAAGESTIITTILQVIINHVDVGMSLPAALAAPG